jgi:hypothetical protein
MTKSPRTQPLSPIPAPRAPHQLRMAFESAVLLDLTVSERANVITQLATLLLQAAGQAAGDDDGQH